MTADVSGMIVAEDPRLKVGQIGAGAWSAAVQLMRGSVPTDDEATTLEWRAAGILNTDGEVDADWARALATTQDARTGLEVVSVWDEVVFGATLFVEQHTGHAVCVTARATHDEAGVVDAVHPLLEVALAPAADPWLLLRRVLPPLEALRATPRAPRPEEVREVALTDIEIPERLRANPELFAQHLITLPTLPRAVADAVEPQASVFAFGLSADGDGMRATSQAWALGKLGLYRVDADAARVEQVPPGDLGHRLVEAVKLPAADA